MIPTSTYFSFQYVSIRWKHTGWTTFQCTRNLGTLSATCSKPTFTQIHFLRKMIVLKSVIDDCSHWLIWWACGFQISLCFQKCPSNSGLVLFAVQCITSVRNSNFARHQNTWNKLIPWSLWINKFNNESFTKVNFSWNYLSSLLKTESATLMKSLLHHLPLPTSSFLHNSQSQIPPDPILELGFKQLNSPQSWTVHS